MPTLEIPRGEEYFKLHEEIQAAREKLLNERVDKFIGRVAMLPITQASDGTPRVRGYIIDSDGYAGYVEDSHYAGAAFLPESTLLEIHYPIKSQPKTYKYRIDHERLQFSVEMESNGQHMLAVGLTDDEAKRHLYAVRNVLGELGEIGVRSYEDEYKYQIKRAEEHAKHPNSIPFVPPHPYKFITKQLHDIDKA